MLQSHCKWGNQKRQGDAKKSVTYDTITEKKNGF